jgi:lipid II:glycine glycyltransferase (peptidoglycan interpeptide bridge formation enzyme)
MIEIFRKKNGLLIRELYFATNIISSTANRDIDMYVQCKVPIADSKPFYSLKVDLLQDEEAIYNSMSKSFRYELRRAEKDGIDIEIKRCNKDQDLMPLYSFYNNFAAYRGIEKTNVIKMEAFKNAGNLTIAVARRSHDNLMVAVYFEIHDDYQARSYYGATLPRIENHNIDKQVIGRTSKLMQWKLICHVKNDGAHTYDLGGISRDTKLKGVDNFKYGFGGVDSEEYNAIIGVSNLGKLALKTSNLFGHFPRAA